MPVLIQHENDSTSYAPHTDDSVDQVGNMQAFLKTKICIWTTAEWSSEADNARRHKKRTMSVPSKSRPPLRLSTSLPSMWNFWPWRQEKIDTRFPAVIQPRRSYQGDIKGVRDTETEGTTRAGHGQRMRQEHWDWGHEKGEWSGKWAGTPVTEVMRMVNSQERGQEHRHRGHEKGEWSRHTPSTAFRHLPPNSARFSYATEGALFISAQLSTDAVSALRKVWVLIWLQKQPSAPALT